MAVPTTLVGLLPTYAKIGPWAPTLLIVLRLLQGLSVGGEMTGSITFMVESAPPNRRGLAGSWAYVGVGAGFLLGSAAGSVVTGLLSPAAVDSWGWRIPFLLGSVIAVCGYLIRRQGITETYQPADAEISWYKGPVRLAFTRYGRQMMQAIGISAYLASGFYLIFTYVATYLVTIVGDRETAVFDINSINMIVYAGMSLVGGLLGDRFGFRRVLLTLAVVGLILAWPLFWLIDHPNVVRGRVRLRVDPGPLRRTLRYDNGAPVPAAGAHERFLDLLQHWLSRAGRNRAAGRQLPDPPQRRRSLTSLCADGLCRDLDRSHWLGLARPAAPRFRQRKRRCRACARKRAAMIPTRVRRVSPA